MSVIVRTRLAMLNAAVPLTKAIGHVHAPFAHRQVVGGHVHVAERRLIPGQVLVTRTRGELTNLFIPGDFTHAAIYAGHRRVSIGGIISEIPVVIEAVSPCVRVTSLAAFMLTKDRVLALSPRFSSTERMMMAAERATWMVGAPYDFVFAPSTERITDRKSVKRAKAFYCAELAYDAYRSEFGSDMKFVPRLTMGVETITPQDFVDALKFWTIQFDTAAIPLKDVDIQLLEAA